MKPKKLIRIILKDQAKEEYERLCKIVEEQRKAGRKSSEESQLLKSINAKISLLKSNPIYGQNIPKSLIPKTLGVDNLFRVSLTHYWRMLYTLKTNEVEIVSFVLYIVDHPSYDRILGYKGRS
jgi:Txe/YoeB family toxin of Txe-Axe toxin-antitoxin module